MAKVAPVWFYGATLLLTIVIAAYGAQVTSALFDAYLAIFVDGGTVVGGCW